MRDLLSRWAAAGQFAMLGRPEAILFFGAGLGDDLMLTCVAREMKKRGAERIVVMSRHRQLFENNPDIAGVVNWSYPAMGRLRRWGYPCHCPHYGHYYPETDKDVALRGHYLEIMCHLSGVKGMIFRRPYFQLSTSEKEKGRLDPAQAVIQSAGLAAMKNKQWPVERYQAVAGEMQGKVKWVQLGLANDPLIRGALDLRGRTTLRESAAIVANAKFFLGEAGFLMHLARAVETRSVIVYGGREDPEVSGYRANENVVGRTPCSPCWQRTRCDFGHECMTMIGPDLVLAAAHRQLERAGTPLDSEEVDLDAVVRAAG